MVLVVARGNLTFLVENPCFKPSARLRASHWVFPTTKVPRTSLSRLLRLAVNHRSVLAGRCIVQVGFFMPFKFFDARVLRSFPIKMLIAVHIYMACSGQYGKRIVISSATLSRRSRLHPKVCFLSKSAQLLSTLSTVTTFSQTQCPNQRWWLRTAMLHAATATRL